MAELQKTWNLNSYQKLKIEKNLKFSIWAKSKQIN